MKILWIVSLLSATAWAAAVDETVILSNDHPAIQYQNPPNDPVAQLAAKVESGQVKLDYANDGWGYLRGLLKQFGINIDSQMLVFSKTSFQSTKISPQAPRALYFNDEVSVGFV